ncbi:MAG: chromosome segregation protein SMC, partial [Desulfobacterales bacterium]|nr:chromosome segregation protein SMC [Desulfobacterales bacterium]
QIKSKFSTAQKDAKIIENYLHSNTGDESLVTQLAGIEEQFNNLISIQQNISAEELSLLGAEKQLKSAIKEFSRHSGKVASHTQKLNDTQRQVGDKKTSLSTLLGKHLLREYRTEKETRLREMAFFKKIADLKSAREKLEDGHPCPLCGAEKHPYAEGNVPEADETEKRINALSDLIDKAERLESDIKTLGETEKKLSVKVTETAKLEAEAANKKQIAEKALSDFTEDLSKNKKEFTHLKQAALTRLQPLGIKEIPDSDLGGLLTTLRTRRKLWQEQQQKREKIETQLAELNGNLKEINAIITTQSISLKRQQSELGTLKDEHAILAAERAQLFGNKIPHLEEARLVESVAAAESAEKTLRREYDAV